MSQVAPTGPSAYPMFIYIEHELVVSADVHNEMLRRVLQIENLSKVQYRFISLRSIRTGYPFGAPEISQKLRRQLRHPAPGCQQGEYKAEENDD